MKNPDNKGTVGKHPIPHAKGIAKSDEKQQKDIIEYDNKQNEEEE